MPGLRFRRLSLLSGGGRYSIPRLFANGEVGYTMLPGTSYSAQFTERTGASATTPSSADGPVGTHRCLITNRNFIASADGRRPLYKPSIHSYDFDGTDDCFYSDAAIDMTGTDKATVWAVIDTDATASQCINEISANANNNDGSFLEFLSHSVTNRGLWGLRGTVAEGTTTTTALSAGTKYLFCCKFDIAEAARATEILPTINGAVPSTQSSGGGTDAGTGNFGNHVHYIGARADASLRFNGRIGGKIVLGRIATAAEIAAINREIAALHGITLT